MVILQDRYALQASLHRILTVELECPIQGWPDSNRKTTNFTKLSDDLTHSASRIFFHFEHTQDNIKNFMTKLLLDKKRMNYK